MWKIEPFSIELGPFHFQLYYASDTHFTQKEENEQYQEENEDKLSAERALEAHWNPNSCPNPHISRLVYNTFLLSQSPSVPKKNTID